MKQLQPSTHHTAQFVVWFAGIIMFTLRAHPLHVSPLSYSSLSRVLWPILIVYLWTQLGDSGGRLELCQQLQLAVLYLPYHSSSRLILLRPDNTRTNNPRTGSSHYFTRGFIFHCPPDKRSRYLMSRCNKQDAQVKQVLIV